MDKRVFTGIEQLLANSNYQQLLKGNIALLYHNASITNDFSSTLHKLINLCGSGLIKLFGPQHGVVSDVQDNMVESDHSIHPYYQLPIYSLYSKTRRPTREMLTDIDTFIIDLQDVGTRVYTYITTLQFIMEAIAEYDLDIKLIILDRPNPLGGEITEGAILSTEFSSFVGQLPIAQRHAMTIGEIARFIQQQQHLTIDLTVIPLLNWQRSMFFSQTGLKWINPSPNLPTIESSYCFAGTVLFEGTNLSEGRGTTRSLELVGHPQITDPWSLAQEFLSFIQPFELSGFKLRPLFFLPTFQKHQGKQCGGWHIHPTDLTCFRPWKLTQLMVYFFYHHPTIDFAWNQAAYEYEFEKLAIDLINGTDKLRDWVEQQRPLLNINQLEQIGQAKFLQKRQTALLYPEEY